MVGGVRIFSGENVQLKCTVPDEATWRYLWFKGSEQLPQSGETMYIWRAQFRDSGPYCCQAVKEKTGRKSQKSRLLEITVDGRCPVIRQYYLMESSNIIGA